jgi:cation transport ATPase
MENKQSKTNLKDEDVNLNYLSDKELDAAKKAFETTPKDTGNKISKVKKHTIISSLLLIPGAMLFTSAHSSSYTLLFVIFNFFFIAFIVFIVAISVYFFSSFFKKKLSFDKTLYRCCYLAAFLYLIDITHLDFLQLIGSLIRSF